MNTIYLITQGTITPDFELKFYYKIGFTKNFIQRMEHYDTHNTGYNVIDTKQTQQSKKHKKELEYQEKALAKTKGKIHKGIFAGYQTEFVEITAEQFQEINKKGFKYFGI